MFPSCDQELSPLCPGINTVLKSPGVLLPGVMQPAESISLAFTVSGETGVLKKIILAACFLRQQKNDRAEEFSHPAV